LQITIPPTPRFVKNSYIIKHFHPKLRELERSSTLFSSSQGLLYLHLAPFISFLVLCIICSFPGDKVAGA
jgi:hypothetical protein